MNFVLRLLAIGTFTCQLSFGQIDPWERVKLIENGKSVSIVLSSGDTVSGKMHEWRPDGLVLRKGKNKTITVARPDVIRVFLTAGMSRARRAAWAFGIGAAAGAGLYGALVASDGGEDVNGAIVPAGALFIGGISAGIAALMPRHKELIYTAPPATARAAEK